MSNIKQLSSAIRFALFVGAASGLASATAIAQEAPKDTKTLEAVEVTGSKIKRVDTETAAPIQIITRAEIEKTGLTNVFDILNNITASDGSGLSTVTTQTNGSDGTQTISLRGLGPSRTLILVDGHRWVSIDGIVDTTTIPVAIVERIDVLKEGASAIYGSDAIAGVINIITRKNFEGAQLGTSYGAYSKGDGGQTGVDLTIGANGERTNVVFGANYTNYDAVMASDRTISRASRIGCSTPVANSRLCGSSISEFGNFYESSLGAYLSWTPGSVGPTADPSQYHTNNFLDRFNFAPQNYLKQPSEIYNLYMHGRFQITDSVSAYARASFTKRDSTQQLASVPMTINNFGSSGPQWTFPVSGAGIFNPFGEDINFFLYRMSGGGPRRFISDHNAYGIQLGLQGDFSLGDHNFNWELMGQRNDYQQHTRGENFMNLSNYAQAVGPSGYDAGSDTLYCGTSYATRINNCVPLNIFQGPDFGVGRQITGAPAGRVLTQAEIDAALAFVSYTLVQADGFTSNNYAGNLSGDLFDLPGGTASFAVGFETRNDHFFNQPDSIVAGGHSSTNFQEPTSGDIKVDEAYLEISLPLLKDLFLAKSLEFTAAIRKSNYDASGLVGGNVVNPDIGNANTTSFSAKWKPIDDLLVRATIGETFHAPSVQQLFGGGTENFPAAQDPCNDNTFPTLSAAQQAICIANGVPAGGEVQTNAQVRALSGGDPTLKPEFGKNRTFGLVYSPSWVDGLDVSLDYWHIRLNDYIVQFGAQATMDQCVGIGVTAPIPTSCARVIRNANGTINVVRTAQGNAARYVASGYDLGVGYKHDFGDWGRINARWETTKYTSEEFTLGTVTSDFIGQYNGTPNWEYRSTATIGWNKGDWDITWTTRFVSDLEEACLREPRVATATSPAEARVGACNEENPDPSVTGIFRTNHIGSTTYHDLNIAWKTPWDARISVGARNLFGKEPPTVNGSFAHSFDAAYDLPGGAFYYAQYRQDF